MFNNCGNTRARPFRLETMWTSHPDFIKIVKQAWDKNKSLLGALSSFELEVTGWAKSTFGDIFQTKRRLLGRLQGIQSSPNYPGSNFLLDLENRLIIEYSEILKREEKYWKLRSRINWLAQGDANTKFFHSTTLNRHRRNKILSLQIDDGS